MNRKTIIAIIYLSTIIFFGTLHRGSCSSNIPVLRILNWSEYILIDERLSDKLPITQRSPLLRDFISTYNCKIEYFEYESTIEMYKKVYNLPGFYDVIIVSNGEVRKMRDGGVILPLNKNAIPNYKFIMSEYRGLASDPDDIYTVPYLIGTTGIAYNEKMVGKSIRSWKDFFAPKDVFKNKIGIFNDYFIVFSIALQSLGFDPNTSDSKSIKAAGKLIYNLNKEGFIGLRSSNVEETTEKLLKNELAMALMYSGDALAAGEASQNSIKYMIPKEGCEFYIDSFVIQKNAPNKKLAHQFINYAISPKMHAETAMYLKYCCPNKEGIEIIRKKAPDQLQNPAIYPPKDVLDKLKVYANTNSEIQRLWNKIFN